MFRVGDFRLTDSIPSSFQVGAGRVKVSTETDDREGYEGGCDVHGI